MSDLLVYAVGDSVMFGQGVADEHSFASLAASTMAQARDRTPKFRTLAHSGATIKSTREARAAFVSRFPHLFPNEADERAFVGPVGAGSDFVPDERPAELDRLHGEIPRAFPTVLHQVRRIPDADAERVDVLLLTGGANDMDFETVFQQSGDFLAALDKDYKRIFHDDVLELITAARRRCPNAQIVVTGYYSAFSPESRFGAMRDMFLELTNKKTEYKVFTTINTIAPVLGFVINRMFGITDRIADAVALARATSEAGESRAHYWMRRAITEINEEPALAGVRGPGVIFAAPGFHPSNCMFADESFMWQRFTVDDLDDERRSSRARACPRIDMRGRMFQLLVQLGQPGASGIMVADGIVDLHNDLDGPVELRSELVRLADNTTNPSARAKVFELLRDEVNRIDLTRIASLFHPNVAGAARYAKVVHRRAEQLRAMSVRERLLAFLPPGQRAAPPRTISVGRTIRRLGLDPAAGLRGCLSHAEPDVIGLTVRSTKTGDVFTSDAFLDLGGGGRWKLRHLLMRDLTGDLDLNPHFEPGTKDFFTIDVAGQLRIGDVTQAVIEFEQKDEGATWRPEAVRLEIDGCKVVDLSFKPPRDVSRRLDLGLPA